MFFMRTYRWPKLMWALFIFELAPTVALLALFGIADPDLYRTQFWTYGYKQGWNSSPEQELLAAANYEPYTPPLPWSQFITSWNLVISVLSTFLLLTKVTMHIMGIFWPIVSVIMHATLVAVYTFSVYGQAAPDNSDPKHPTNGPCWYITKSCSEIPGSLQGYCKQAKSAFAVTIIMLILFAFHMFFAAVCCKPTPEARQKYEKRRAEKEVDKAFEKQVLAEQRDALAQSHQWELRNFPQTPGTAGAMKSPYAAAYTPRTVAFQNLGGMPSPHTPRPVNPPLARSPTGGSAGGSVTNYSKELPLRQSQEARQPVPLDPCSV